MKNLRLLRESGKMSQQKLADKFDLAQSQIHAYENDSYEPDINTLKQFARFFDTSIDYLVGNTDIRHKIEPVEQYDLNEEEASLLEKYRRLPPTKRKSVIVVLDALLGDE